jgi:hypothetical protein
VLENKLNSVVEYLHMHHMSKSAADVREAADRITYLEDQATVRQFANRLCNKMAQNHMNGKRGWRTIPIGELRAVLHVVVNKGDMRDVALLAMMIDYREQASAQDVGKEDPGTTVLHADGVFSGQSPLAYREDLGGFY